jgi:cyclopropane-fatty-acyl-phospholipid synthase
LRILDIGSGWGDLAFYLAALEDVDITGVTLSKEQYALSNEKARRLGISDRVRFLLRDYRDVPERFDRIVSVGMFEHVGVHHYAEFFAKITLDYSDWRWALAREFLQNCMDAPGCKTIFVRVGDGGLQED